MNQLVSRTVCDTKPITVAYSATDYAGRLKEVIDTMVRWGEKSAAKDQGRNKNQTPR